jgi:oligo-1,6-glucosidase
MRAETFDKYGAVTVGETPGVGMEMSKLLTADYRKELDMVFSFDHLETPGHVRFDEYQYDLNYLKSYYIDWMEHFGPHCWMSLFYENHDNPRMISKVNPNPAYREVLGKLLALIQLTLRGTPFIFQGQELGRINQNFSSIEEMSDIESLNHYHDWLEDYTPQEAFQKVLAGSRDHARTPMAWDDSLHGGFSSATPWIVGDTDYKTCNVASEEQNPNSVLQFYRALIALRKENHALIYGDFQALHPHRKDLFTYTRTLDGTTFCIECNLSDKPIRRQDSLKHYKRILSNYKEGASMLRPYEATIYRKD